MDALDANAKLIEALRVVQDRQASGADDWEFSLLRTFVKYLEEIGVERELLLPIWRMSVTKWNEIENARRRQEGKSGTPAPADKTLPMEFAAAAVTVLKRQGKGNIGEVLTLVASAAGIDRKALKSFRDNINRGLLERSSEAYKRHIQQIEAEGWLPAEIMESLATLRGFVS